ncbi:MAG TPA: class I SAM-dependent rRNA methyltransferase [Polyangiaceae bacterium]|nr:class I SAM-dependent rRNA methyltransferase [Polyangiaceae bacterium]
MNRNAVPEVVVAERHAGERIAKGHPWVWRDSVLRGLDHVGAGDEVQVVTPNGSPLGRGLAEPESPIAVRMWTSGREPVSAALWRERARRAARLRALLFADARTTAYRIVHGEGDRMPGLVIDRYDSVAVVQCDGAAIANRLADVTEALWPELDSRGIATLVHRTSAKGTAPRLQLLRGSPAADTVHVREDGVPFIVDVAHGQKTGAFLDQRENRRRVGELASGRRVLNLFSYTGGFSIHAALGSATHVTSVDTAAAAHATAQASFRAAGIDPAPHAFVVADVRTFLEGARERGEAWDLIVSDPPSFAPNERSVRRALTAYRAIHRACVAVLSDGGLLCAASCSSHIDADAFLSTLDAASLGGRQLKLLELSGAGPDHPSLPAFPEGRYLKFAMLSAS